MKWTTVVLPLHFSHRKWRKRKAKGQTLILFRLSGKDCRSGVKMFNLYSMSNLEVEKIQFKCH